MFYVLEHIEDEIIFFKKTVYPLLANKGKILLTVPAYQYLFSKHDINLKHFRRYNIRMIQECCNKSNLNVVSFHYFYASLLPVRLITKLLNKDNEINEWQYNDNHILTKFVKNVLTVDYNICKKMNKLSFGLSLFVVIEKK